MKGEQMNYYVVEVSHSWTAIFEAESHNEAKEQALAMDAEIPCDEMGTDVTVEVADERS
jgi:hypothetical protein